MSEPPIEDTKKQVPKTRPNSLYWSNDKEDIGIQRLRTQRDSILYAGKYSERYKDCFKHELSEDKFPLTLKCRDTMDMYRKVAKGEKMDPATTKLAAVSKSNATNDLNKRANTLIGYKPVPDGTHRVSNPTSPASSPKTSKWVKKSKDVNIYNVTPTDGPISPTFAHRDQPVALSNILNNTDSTLDHLQNVESIISKLHEKEKKDENLKKFEELLKKVNGPKATTAPSKPSTPQFLKEKLQKDVIKKQGGTKSVDQSQEMIKDQEHILNPMKHCSEVEDLQARGLSDESESNREPFKRDVKERKSMDHAAIKEKKNVNNGSLSRTASDAQKLPAKNFKRREAISTRERDRNRKVSFSYYY
ncbi:unnamed protein product [Acanthoscelides obtectus]|uniref:Uncharacterized protein n=1 Tax=Acanthoscelides obtectus TaxID=200917 RepID=A0A9P0LNP9_ACAOB|nr:unnamed protein product [Acanthoscelides obtectus]CAK1643795.1 hypothetical protein AOBTE_LOCUS13677 [Acanthoscelides obtectus]